MLALLGACVTLYWLWRPFTRANPWPRRFLAGFGRLAGARVRCVGAPPRRGAILLANHQSWLDIPLLAGATGCAFVAHAGLAEQPLMRWLCAMNDTVFVARADRRSVARQAAQVRAALHDLGLLAIFPEGGTGDGRALLPFKSSLLAAVDPPPPGIVVQPVRIDFGPVASELAWVGDENGVSNFFKVLARRRPFVATIEFLAPFDPVAVGGRKAIAAEARARIAASMGVA